MTNIPAGIRKMLSHIPGWVFTIICIIAILWLTLAPDPLGDTELPLFPGADKICHAIMFGGLVWCILLDYERRKWIRPTKTQYIIAIAASALFGILIEYLQGMMALGRSYDSLDSMADLVGTIVFGLTFIPISSWLLKK